MAINIKLEANKREIIGKKVYTLRQEGKVPAVLYGRGIKNQNLEFNAVLFGKIYEEAGSNTIIDLVINGEDSVKVLISDTQQDPVTDNITHIDLQQVRMDEKITANVEIEFIGEAPAVKTDGGVFISNLNEIEIKCLPLDLIHEIKVDISKLITFFDLIISLIKYFNLSY